MFRFLLLALISAVVTGKVYFHEKFNDKDWKKRWTVSTEWKAKGEMGEWKWTAGQWYGDETDMGIQTGEDARFYGISAKMDSPFDNKDKQLVVQLSVKHEQDLDCGGAYLKLLGDMDQSKFGGDTPYQIMFGPDICGAANRKTHVIFNYPPKNENLLITNPVKVETDKLSHLYSLVVNPDNTFEVFIDLVSVKKGSLEENWEFLKPREIKDPSLSKPEDWVDTPKMFDPEDKKPEGWDDIPEEIPDPNAKKPDDWDDEEDGEYQPPMIDNPEFKGPWRAREIDHPGYKGPWIHPMIPNPDFEDDPYLHHRCKDCSHVGFELWQVKSGTIFDDILISDSWEEAKEIAQKTFMTKKAGEKEMFDIAEEERKEKEAEAKRLAEEEAKKNPPKSEDDEEAGEEDHDEL